jgi:hypothetical protein
LPILPFLIYRALTTRDLKDKNLYRIAGAAFAGTLPPWLGLLILLLITFARTGQVFQFADLLYGPMVFYQSGFYMMRMPLIHEWILLVVFFTRWPLAKSMKDLSFMKTSGVASGMPLPDVFLSFHYGLGFFPTIKAAAMTMFLPFVCWPDSFCSPVRAGISGANQDD